MPHATAPQQSPGTWSIEGQHSMIGYHSLVDKSTNNDGKLFSQCSEPWTDARTEISSLPNRVSLADHLFQTQSVPPSPTYNNPTRKETPGNQITPCRDKMFQIKRSNSFNIQSPLHHGDYSERSKISCSKINRLHGLKTPVSTSSSSPRPCAFSQIPCSRVCCPCGESEESSQCSCSSLSSSQSFGHKSLGDGKESLLIASIQSNLLQSSTGIGDTRITTSVMDIPSAVKSCHKKSASVGSYRQLGVPENDFSSSVGWPTPVPVKNGPLCPPASSTLETLNVFKYRIHYPSLLLWAQECMQARMQGDGHLSEYKSPFLSPRNTDTGLQFMQEVLNKQKLKAIELGKPSLPLTDFDHQRSQLWKRRFYTLLDAVDLVFKDNQILHYVSREALFQHVASPPTVPRVLYSRRFQHSKRPNSWWWNSGSASLGPQTYSAMSIDPVGQLSERVTQLIVNMRIHDMDASQLKSRWPCNFTVSVSFLSDVMAQSRILRCELDKRLAVRERLHYVLGQAREQRSKLKLHLLKQRELVNVLTDRISMINNQLLAPSPGQDQPSSIEQSLANNIDSPFIDCEAAENDLTEQVYVNSDANENDENISYSQGLPTQVSPTVGPVIKHCIQQYRERRAELQARILALERVLKEEETRRKRLHNRIQEITGNIRVFCRLRPRETGLMSNADAVNEEPKKSYLRVISDDKLLFCSETLREQVPGQIRAAWGSNSSSSLMAVRSFNSNTGTTSVISNTMLPNSNGIGPPPKCFIFDRVFGPKANQTDVYDEVDDLIISCMDGYNVCIMAYGQTGSGKTYTMMGTQDNPGVNRRAIKSLFERCSKRKQWRFSILTSMVEIYQEDVFDLLEERNIQLEMGGTETPRSIGQSSVKGGGHQVLISRGLGTSKWDPHPVCWNAWKKNASQTLERGFASGRPIRRRGSVKIMSDHLDGIVLQNLTERRIHNEEEMCSYLERAEKQRRVGFTKLNICSSRSHLIIMLKVIGENQLHQTTSRGSLTLADLAGSENVNKSGSTGERFMEAACINKSLSSLGRVFDALRRQQKPTYRETKLTYILRPNLSGDSKVLLFVALRTEPEHAEETWRAVNFGQGALQVVPGAGGPATCDMHSSGLNLDNLVFGEQSMIASAPPRSPATPLFRCVSTKHRLTTQREMRHSLGRSIPFSQTVYSMGPSITKRNWK